MTGGSITNNISYDKGKISGGGGIFNASGSTATLTGVTITGYETNNKDLAPIKIFASDDDLYTIVLKDNEVSLVKQAETSIKGIENGQITIDNSWYDLSGRKLDAKPTTKGVYVLNGRKVVIN